MINTTLNANMNTKLNKTYYDRQLLESAKTRFVHASFGQTRPIPRNSGKRVEFRRWNVFDANNALTALEEGVTPSSQILSQTSVEATVNQYGAYVEVSDLLDLTAYDQVISDSAELLGEQLGTVVEWITRDAMCSGSNVQRANGKTARNTISASDKLTVDEVRKAVRALKRAKARPFNDGTRKPHFVCICSPEATYDLQSDQLWQDVSKYANAEQIYSGEIGRLFGVVFVESTEAKIFKQSLYSKLSSAVTNSKEIQLATFPTYDELAYLSVPGHEIYVGDQRCYISAYAEQTNTITLSTPVTAESGAPVYTKDGGLLDEETCKAADVHATLIFGKDAYGVVDVEGNGALEIIIKPQGSSGTADPLNQRGTVGAKVAAYTAKILNDLWIVRIEHGVSA